MKYKKSILTDDMGKCYMCGRTMCIEIHHIFGGYRRKISTQNGFVVPLCTSCHNVPPNGVHFNKERLRLLQEDCERKFLETHSFREWMSLMGRNFLDIDEIIDK